MTFYEFISLMKETSDKKIFEKIQELINLDNQKVLEIGCGDGRISKFIIKNTDNLIGIDPSEDKIKDAQVKIPKGRFLVGSGENLVFPNAFFDLIIFTLSLHHQDSRKALREATRVLKKDGLILVIEPVIEGEVERVFAIVNNEDQAKIDAQQAITESDLIVGYSETFYAHWIFENHEDLSEYIFNYYDLPFDPILAQKMYDFIGVNARKRPLTLIDRMIIQALSK